MAEMFRERMIGCRENITYLLRIVLLHLDRRAGAIEHICQCFSGEAIGNRAQQPSQPPRNVASER
jgi:hypothetical protein